MINKGFFMVKGVGSTANSVTPQMNTQTAVPKAKTPGVPNGMSTISSMAPAKALEKTAAAPVKRKAEEPPQNGVAKQIKTAVILPVISPEHKKKIDGILSEAKRINESCWLIRVINLVQLAMGNSHLRGDFLTLKHEVHFLSCFAHLRTQKDKWKLVAEFFASTSLQGHMIDRFKEYHTKWKDRITDEQIKVFCSQTGICNTLGSRYLKDGSKESLRNFVQALIDASDVA